MNTIFAGFAIAGALTLAGCTSTVPPTSPTVAPTVAPTPTPTPTATPTPTPTPPVVVTVTTTCAGFDSFGSVSFSGVPAGDTITIQPGDIQPATTGPIGPLDAGPYTYVISNHVASGSFTVAGCPNIFVTTVCAVAGSAQGGSAQFNGKPVGDTVVIEPGNLMTTETNVGPLNAGKYTYVVDDSAPRPNNQIAHGSFTIAKC